MIIEKKLQLYNVFSIKDVAGKVDAKKYFDNLEHTLLQNGIYTTGPKIVRRKNVGEKKEIQIYIPLNDKVNTAEDNRMQFFEEMQYNRCLFKRVIGEGDNISRAEDELIRQAYAENMEIDTEGCLFVILPIPDGNVIDIYLPVTGREA